MLAGDIVYAIAPTDLCLKGFSSTKEDWRQVCLERQAITTSRNSVSTAVWRSEHVNKEKCQKLAHKLHDITAGMHMPANPSLRHALPFMRTTEKQEKAREQKAVMKAEPSAGSSGSDASGGVMDTASTIPGINGSRAHWADMSVRNKQDAAGDPIVAKPRRGIVELESPADTINRLESEAYRMAEEGGHYILVVLAGSPWQQIQAFVRALRGSHLPFHVPILCLVPPWEKISSTTIKEVFQSHPRVAAQQMPSHATTMDLNQAGIMRARCVALLAGNAGDSSTVDRRMVDGAGVTLLSGIEALFEHTNEPRSVILELHQQESVSFMHRFPTYENSTEAGNRPNPKESYINHPRFASGGIFTGSCMGALCARAYYTPGIIELLESLVLGGVTGQSSFPWQVAVPKELEHAKYGDLVEAFLADNTLALCLGLYRASWPGAGDGASYVVTNPPLSTQLRPGDLAIVLGSEEFGKGAFERDMLVGVIGSPSANVKEAAPEPERRTSAVESEAKPSDLLINESGEPSALSPPAALADFETGDIPQEVQLPAMTHTQQELTKAQEDLVESKERELCLRARLREQEDELANARMRQAALEARLRLLETPRTQGYEPQTTGARNALGWLPAATDGTALPQSSSGAVGRPSEASAFSSPMANLPMPPAVSTV
jgi:hypothetical protein